MRAEVGEKIFIYEPDSRMRDWCRDSLVIDNPDFIKKERMGLWTGGTPRKLCLYEEVGGELRLPFGCLLEVHSLFPEMPMRSRIRRCGTISYMSHINPYIYQENAIRSALGAKNGIIVMPCGSGKTQTALEIVSRIGMRCLWLTHTQDLLNQSLNRAKSVLGVDNASYGTITGGKVKIGSGITFATVQTMGKIDLTPYKDEWGVIIVDECHKAVGSPTKAMQFYKVLSQLSCRYKYGLTATPRRSDGLQRTMTALIGEIVHVVTREEVADTTCPVYVQTIRTGYEPNLDIALCGDGTINYAGLVEDLTSNQERMNLVSAVLNNNCNGATLVLANRVKYLEQLRGMYEGKSVCLSSMGNSKAAKAARKEALRKLNSGETDCIFATYQLAKEGLDVPNLRYVVFATPEKDEATVMQAAGRVARKADGKDRGVVIDFIDDFGMLIGWAKKRQRIYEKKLDCILT